MEFTHLVIFNRYSFIFFNKKSYEPADKEHPFGHGKYEYIGSLITSIILLFVSYELVKEIILKEEIIRPNILGSFIVIITIIIKIIMATILIKKGKNMIIVLYLLMVMKE